MLVTEIQEQLCKMRDADYGDFQAKLLPTVDYEKVIGVRTPELRKYAKELVSREDICEFTEHLPHEYFEENQLHAFILSLDKDYAHCLAQVCEFLPYVDNWATCDQMTPKVFKKHRKELVPQITMWLESQHTYTIRFGVKMLMDHFLNEDFDPKYPAMVAGLQSGEYYVNMMIAWYFATALAKQYEKVLPFIEEHKLDPWTHNKAIQKAVESYRVTPEHKEYLRSLRVRS